MAAAALAAACTSSAGSPAPRVSLVPAAGGAPAVVEVAGLARAERRALAGVRSAGEWERVLAVRVRSAARADHPAVAGRYALQGDAIRFTPTFPFDPGREYEVTFDASAIPGAAGASRPVTAVVSLPAAPAPPPTFVTEVYPSGKVIPENQLRLYIHFSAPMGRGAAIAHVKLVDDRGREVVDPFLPLEAEFWDTDRARYTVFFDPGRQKRGILPNRRMGRSLVAGREYSLLIDRGWEDAQGRALRETFTLRFRVGPADLAPIDPQEWRIVAPAAGTRDALTVAFPEPLDRALLYRALGVRRDGQPIRGDVRVEDAERRWTFTPAEPWRDGPHELLALSILEDRSGNRIGRAFEILSTKKTDGEAEPAPTVIPFTVGQGRRP